MVFHARLIHRTGNTRYQEMPRGLSDGKRAFVELQGSSTRYNHAFARGEDEENPSRLCHRSANAFLTRGTIDDAVVFDAGSLGLVGESSVLH
jgi:hypothetical protein